jgi:hypothetical protein
MNLLVQSSFYPCRGFFSFDSRLSLDVFHEYLAESRKRYSNKSAYSIYCSDLVAYYYCEIYVFQKNNPVYFARDCKNEIENILSFKYDKYKQALLNDLKRSLTPSEIEITNSIDCFFLSHKKAFKISSLHVIMVFSFLKRLYQLSDISQNYVFNYRVLNDKAITFFFFYFGNTYKVLLRLKKPICFNIVYSSYFEYYLHFLNKQLILYDQTRSVDFWNVLRNVAGIENIIYDINQSMDLSVGLLSERFVLFIIDFAFSDISISFDYTNNQIMLTRYIE